MLFQKNFLSILAHLHKDPCFIPVFWEMSKCKFWTRKYRHRFYFWLEKFSSTESLKSNSEFSVPVICSCLVLTPVSMSALFPKKYKLSFCRCHGPLFGNLRIFSELRLPVRFTGPPVVPVGQGGIIGCVLLCTFTLYVTIVMHYVLLLTYYLHSAFAFNFIICTWTNSQSAKVSQQRFTAISDFLQLCLTFIECNWENMKIYRSSSDKTLWSECWRKTCFDT